MNYLNLINPARREPSVRLKATVGSARVWKSVLLAAAFPVLAHSASAAAIFVGSGSKSFSATASWSSGTVPAVTDILGTPLATGTLGLDDSPSDPAASTVKVAGIDVDLSAVGFSLVSQTAIANTFIVTGDINKIGSKTLLFRDGGSSATAGTLTMSVGGAINQDGGILNFGDANKTLTQLTVAGLTTVTSGTLAFISTSAHLNGGLQVASAGVVDIYNAASGTGGISVSKLSGAGTVIATSVTSSTVAATLTLDGTSGSATFSGALTDGTGTLALAKTGASTQILTGANTYTGTTTVSAGTLLVDGSLGNTAVTVGASGALGGTGSIGGPVTINGTLTPGDGGVGALTINNSLVLGSSASALLEAAGTAGSAFDRIVLTGVGSNLTLDGTITLSLVGGFVPTTGSSFDLLDWTGTLTSSGFNVGTDLILPTLAGGQAWDTSSFLTNGTVSVITAVPEPQTYALLGLGLAVLGWVRLRRPASHEGINS